MFSFENLQRVQPVSYTGAIRHSSLWLTSSLSDQIYPNSRFERSEQNPLDQGTVIICIHGTADRASAFSLIAERLIGELPSTISAMMLLAFDQRYTGQGIEVFAEQTLLKLKAYNIKNVILLGHSRGGLVAAYFAEYLAQAAKIHVRGIFAIATPFDGSVLATAPLIWISNSVNQMQIGSETLQALAKKIATSLIKYYSLIAENDGIVTDPHACKPKTNCHDSKIFDRHGHLSIMSSHRVVEYMRSSIFLLMKTHQTKKSNGEKERLQAQDTISTYQSISTDLCYLIELQMTALKIRHPEGEAEAKIDVYKDLIQLLHQIEKSGKIKKYQHTHTLGGLIDAFLHDKKTPDHEKPIDILSKQLTLPLLTFWREKCKSLLFIESIVEKLKLVTLPLPSHYCSSSISPAEDKSASSESAAKPKL
jgi:pimeloyl-ACP methyl ester carboxylesterase